MKFTNVKRSTASKHNFFGGPNRISCHRGFSSALAPMKRRDCKEPRGSQDHELRLDFLADFVGCPSVLPACRPGCATSVTRSRTLTIQKRREIRCSANEYRSGSSILSCWSEAPIPMRSGAMRRTLSPLGPTRSSQCGITFRHMGEEVDCDGQRLWYRAYPLLAGCTRRSICLPKTLTNFSHTAGLLELKERS